MIGLTEWMECIGSSSWNSINCTKGAQKTNQSLSGYISIGCGLDGLKEGREESIEGAKPQPEKRMQVALLLFEMPALDTLDVIGVWE
jgi:hypothetical protein